jgi:hypothetical protein
LQDLIHHWPREWPGLAALVNPTSGPVFDAVLADLHAAAPNLGPQIDILNASTNRDIDAAFASLVQNALERYLLLPTRSLAAVVRKQSR